MTDLFDHKLDKELKKEAPLADRLRPQNFNDFQGQEKIVGQGKILRKAIENDELFSIILWGPPGSGKTTLARIIANLTKSSFVQLSAVTSGKKDLIKVIEKAREKRKLKSQRTILFVDEIHRWNKAQQDALLPYVEKGIIVFIGATTENPSFEIIAPLLSRSRVFVLESLGEDDLGRIIKQALKDKEVGLGNYQVKLGKKALGLLLSGANGDARAALNALELAVKAVDPDQEGFRHIKEKDVREALQYEAVYFDKKGEQYYNIISAFIKSMRGSDPDAALYWLARMVEAGQDPLYIARRMVIFASEDISLADKNALSLAVSCFQACHQIGWPECQINLAHVAVYLALAPKDNSTYQGLLKAKKEVKKTMNEPVSLPLRNAVTGLMKDLGYGQDYKYSHDYDKEEGEQDYLPQKLKNKKFFNKKKDN
ncbi:MAG: replication-associated recombination protein A [Patescibacteria group bacterium]|nr:replication-associated recombination protein A [Patescibacteria group bacterium]